MSAAMTREEREAFLAGVHVGVISIARSDRAPLAVPVWYGYTPGGEVFFICAEAEIMTETVDIGTLIDRSPDVHGNRPKIAGTGVTVRRIAGWYVCGYCPEEIVRKIPSLTLAQVHAALAYYHANRHEIDQDLASDEALYEQLAAEHAPRAS